MRYTLCLFAIILIFSCNGQEISGLAIVPYGKNPITPSQSVLQQKSQQKFEELEVKTELLNQSRTLKTFYLDGQLFEGWAYQVFIDTDHRFRYTRFEKGLAVWQIGYFDNGDLGHDFHMKDGLNKGCQRMWHKGGGLYIDTFFLEGEILDGPQYRWYSNGQLGREAVFKNGELIYEVLFDQTGTITERKGIVPEKYQ